MSTLWQQQSVPGEAPCLAARCGLAEKDLSVREVCDLMKIADMPGQRQCEQRFEQRVIVRGRRLIDYGGLFSQLFIVVRGAFKTVMFNARDEESILAFPAHGDLVGIDGICSGVHATETVALTDALVVSLPFKQLGACARQIPGLEDALFSVFQRELSREKDKIKLINSLPLEARVAFFLLALSDRQATQGANPYAFGLAMTLREMGAYLAASLAGIRASLDAFEAQRLIALEGSQLHIDGPLAMHGLRMHVRAAAEVTGGQAEHWQGAA